MTAPLVEIDAANSTFSGDVQIDGNATLGTGGGAAIARVGDSVAGGVITSGSANHTAT